MNFQGEWDAWEQAAQKRNPTQFLVMSRLALRAILLCECNTIALEPPFGCMKCGWATLWRVKLGNERSGAAS